MLYVLLCYANLAITRYVGSRLFLEDNRTFHVSCLKVHCYLLIYTRNPTYTLM